MKWTKTTSDSDRITLIFELYRRIPKSQKITAKELQTQLADSGIYRDIRTIQRNLNIVVECFDVEKDDRDKPYGYSRRSNNILFIGASEAILLSLAESFFINLLPVSLRNKIQGAFKDARNQLLPGNSNDKKRQWLNKVRFTREVQPLLPPKISQTLFESISAAFFIIGGCLFFIQITSKNQRNKEVMPLGLVQQGNRLYLVCRFKSYRDDRTLAVHRIAKATMSTFTFKYPPDFSLTTYDEDVRIGFGEEEKITLHFCIDKVAGLSLLETPLPFDQVVIEHSNYLEVTATVVKSLLLDRWINGFGDQKFNINHLMIEHSYPEKL